MKRYKQYMGIPYEDMGRTNKGVDCWGLVRLVLAEQFYIQCPSYDYNNNDPGELALCIRNRDEASWIETEKPQEGDVVLLRQLREISHVGLMVDSKTFIHASKSCGVVAQSINDKHWKNRVGSFYRHSGLNKVRVIVQDSPFRTTTETTEHEPEILISDLVGKTVEKRWLQFAHVTVQGQVVKPKFWDSARVHRGALVNITLIPKKDSGVLRALLTIAVVVFTGGLGAGALGGLIGHTGLQIAIGQAIVGAVGMMLVDAIAPPPRQDMNQITGTAASSLYSIQGARNRVQQYGMVPLPLGVHRMVPPYGTKPYTSIEGNKQFLHCHFIVGEGPLDISDIRIGDTPIGNYLPDVEWEVREGYATDVPLTLIPSNVDETQLSVLLLQASSPTVRTVAAGTDRVSLDLTLPSGLTSIHDNGSLVCRRVGINVQYRTSPSGAYTDAVGKYVGTVAIGAQGSGYTVGTHYLVFTGGGGSGASCKVKVKVGYLTGVVYSIEMISYGEGYTSAPTVTMPASAGAGVGAVLTASMYSGYSFRDSTRQPQRKNFSFDLPSDVAYDIQVYRTTVDSTSDRVIDKVYWTAIRSISNEPTMNIDYYVGQIAVKILATDKLNGTVDTLSCLAKTKGLQWNPIGSVWDADQIINNPANLYRHVLQGSFRENPVPDSKIVMADLEEWAEFCYTKGFFFNYVIDRNMSIYETLAMIASAGRASYSRDDDKYTIVIDQPQTLPVNIFTPKNSNSLSKHRTYQKPVHCIKVRFINELKDFLQCERRVYSDGYNQDGSGGLIAATVFETLDWSGVTSPDQIWMLTRYQMACAVVRQKGYSLTSDFEALTCKRGALVQIAGDLFLAGLAQGRVQGVTASTITVRENCPMELGETYSVEIRKADQTFETLPLVTVPGDNMILTRTGGSDFTCAVGDLFAFGETGKTSLPVLVKKGRYNNRLGSTFDFFPYDADVYTADSGAIPTYTAIQSLPPDLVAPLPITNLTAAEYLYIEDGVLVQGVPISFDFAENELVDFYEVQQLAPNKPEWELLGRIEGRLFNIYNVFPGIYSFRVKAVRGVLSSPWLTLENEEIDALKIPPPDVVNVQSGFRGNTILITWDPVQDIRGIEYEIRFGTTFSGSILMINQPGTEFSPSQNGTYYIQAKSISGGALSENEASVVISEINLNFNAVQAVTETFVGSFDGACYRPITYMSRRWVGGSNPVGIPSEDDGWDVTINSGSAPTRLGSEMKFLTGDGATFIGEYNEDVVSDIWSVYFRVRCIDAGITDPSWQSSIWKDKRQAGAIAQQSGSSVYISLHSSGGTTGAPFSISGSGTVNVEVRIDTSLDLAYCWVNGILKSTVTLGPPQFSATEFPRIQFITSAGSGSIYVSEISGGNYLPATPTSAFAWYDEGRLGYYTTPTANQLDIGYNGYVVGSVTELVVSIADLVDGSPGGSVVPQIRMKPSGGAWGEWVDFTAKSYFGRYFDVRLKAVITEGLTAEVTSFKWSLDMEDLDQSGDDVAVLITGSSIVFPKQYQVKPVVLVTQDNSSLNDTIIRNNVSLTGFDVAIYDSTGTQKAGVFDWRSKGY